MAQICYYADKLSPNIAKTPEGFLICKNVPIARTGYQQYLESELVEDGNPAQMVNVYRSPKEVFAQATLASFEGKPVTDGHPSEDVNPDNFKRYAKGHVQHVRLGVGDDGDKIVADLYITDPELIQKILDGKREVSAGYYAEDVKEDSGQICQTKIRGNHVAIVDEGRAGPSVAIRDAKCNSLTKGAEEMAKKVSKKKEIARIVSRFLMDEDAGSIDERLKSAAEVLDEESKKDDEDVEAFEEEKMDACKDEEPAEEKKDGDVDVWDAIDSINSRLDALEAKFHGDGDADAEPKADAEPDDAPLADEDADVIASEDADGDVSEPDDDDVEIIDTDEVEEKLSARDSAIREISRAVLGIRDSKERKRMQDAILRVTRRKSQMPGLMSLVKSNKAKRDSGANKNIDVNSLQSIYDKLNPHKGGK